MITIFLVLTTACSLTENEGYVTKDETPDNVEEESINESVDEQIADVGSEVADNEEANYIEADIANLSSDVQAFSYGKGWYLDNSSEEWKCIDTEGNILFSLPYGYEPGGEFVQNLCLRHREGYKDVIIDENGNTVLTDICPTENSDILLLCENKGIINIWIRTIKDTFDGHTEMLQVIDENGTILNEYTPVGGYSFGAINTPGHSSLLNRGDGMFTYGWLVFNTNNNTCFITDEDVLNFDNGYGIVSDYYTTKEIIDLNGNVICNYDSSAHLGKYSEGVYFVGYYEEKFAYGQYIDTYRGAFYNIEGQIELDISQYSLDSFYNFFKDGYCYMRIINDHGIEFSAVMDRNGQFLFEPVKDVKSVYISEGLAVMNIKGDSIQIYDLEQKTVNTLENLKEVGAFHNGWATFKTSSDEEGFLDPYGNHLKVKIKIN